MKVEDCRGIKWRAKARGILSFAVRRKKPLRSFEERKGYIIRYNINYIFSQMFSQSLRSFSLASKLSVGPPIGTDTVTRMLPMVISTISATGVLYIFFIVIIVFVFFLSYLSLYIHLFTILDVDALCRVLHATTAEVIVNIVVHNLNLHILKACCTLILAIAKTAEAEC